jgi:hypothetical protein
VESCLNVRNECSKRLVGFAGRNQAKQVLHEVNAYWHCKVLAHVVLRDDGDRGDVLHGSVQDKGERMSE